MVSSLGSHLQVASSVHAPASIRSPYELPAPPEATAPVGPQDAVTVGGSAAVPESNATPPARRLVGLGLMGLLIPGALAGAMSLATPAFAAPPPTSISVTTAAATATTAPTTVVKARSVDVRDGDSLVITARKGDTMYSYARHFAPDANQDGTVSDTEAKGYLQDIIRANHGSSALKVGQKVTIPVTPRAGVSLRLVLAAQRACSKQFPNLDWLNARVGSGPAESFRVQVPSLDARSSQGFVVADDLSGQHPDRYQVLTAEEMATMFPDLATPAPVAHGTIVARSTEDSALLQVPAGTTRIDLGEGSVVARDAQGNKLMEQDGWSQRARVTTLHAQADPARHQLLTEAADGTVQLQVPAGTRSVLIFPAQTTFDGSILARDGAGRTLATEYNTDFRMVERSSDTLADVTMETMLTVKGNTIEVSVPGGTHELLFSSAQVNYDGSIVALDAQGRGIQMQPNWNGQVSVGDVGQASNPRRGLLVHGGSDDLFISTVPGTRTVTIENGTVRLLDATGHVLAQQKAAPIEFVNPQ